jgi:hypothetical protein
MRTLWNPNKCPPSDSSFVPRQLVIGEYIDIHISFVLMAMLRCDQNSNPSARRSLWKDRIELLEIRHRRRWVACSRTTGLLTPTEHRIYQWSDWKVQFFLFCLSLASRLPRLVWRSTNRYSYRTQDPCSPRNSFMETPVAHAVVKDEIIGLHGNQYDPSAAGQPTL